MHTNGPTGEGQVGWIWFYPDIKERTIVGVSDIAKETDNIQDRSRFTGDVLQQSKSKSIDMGQELSQHDRVVISCQIVNKFQRFFVTG